MCPNLPTLQIVRDIETDEPATAEVAVQALPDTESQSLHGQSEYSYPSEQSNRSIYSSSESDSEYGYQLLRHGGRIDYDRNDPNYHPYEPVALDPAVLADEQRKLSSQEKLLMAYFIQSIVPHTAQYGTKYKKDILIFLNYWFESHFVQRDVSQFWPDDLKLKPLGDFDLNYVRVSNFSCFVRNVRREQNKPSFRAEIGTCFKELCKPIDTLLPFAMKFKLVESRLNSVIFDIYRNYAGVFLNAQALQSFTKQVNLQDPLSVVTTVSIFKYLGRISYILLDVRHFIKLYKFSLYDDLKYLFCEGEIAQILNIIFRYSLFRHLLQIDLNSSFYETASYYFYDDFIRSVMPKTEIPLETIMRTYKAQILHLLHSIFTILLREHLAIKLHHYVEYRHNNFYETLV